MFAYSFACVYFTTVIYNSLLYTYHICIFDCNTTDTIVNTESVIDVNTDNSTAINTEPKTAVNTKTVTVIDDTEYHINTDTDIDVNT